MPRFSGMVTLGLLVRFGARPGAAAELEALLKGAIPQVEDELGTNAWFALQFGRARYGVIEMFTDEAGRATHLKGPVARKLLTSHLLQRAPKVEPFDVLASKLPQYEQPASRAVLLRLRAREGRQGELERFLITARQIVEQEPGTISWFAVRFRRGRLGIFDTFPDARARMAHLTGQVPRELLKHGLPLLGGAPLPALPDIVSESVRLPVTGPEMPAYPF